MVRRAERGVSRQRYLETVWWTAVAVLALFAWGCARGERSPEEIRIGFLVDESTLSAEATVQAAELAVAMVNSAGGVEVGGRRLPVRLLQESTGDTPEGTVRATLELINRERAVAVVGSSFSRNAIPSGEVAERAGVPMICPGSTHPRTTAGRRYVFRVAFVDSFQGRAMARFARDELGLDTAAVLYDVADSYSRDVADLFRRVFEAAGGRVVAFESFTSGESDFRPQLERIRDADPDAVFLPNFSQDVPVQGRQLRALGIDAVLLGSDSWLVELARHPELDGAYFTRSWHRDLAESSPEAEAFRARYRELHGSEPDELVALTYDAFGLLFAALADAPRVAPEEIRAALARIDGHRGLTGPISYRGRGGDPRKNAAIVRIEDGEVRLFELVEAKER